MADAPSEAPDFGNALAAHLRWLEHSHEPGALAESTLAANVVTALSLAKIEQHLATLVELQKGATNV